MNPDKPASAYFFGTCLVDLIYPQAGLAGIQLIQREGVRVIFPQGQTCCGQPAWNSGYRDQARSVALAQIQAFPKDIPIVVPSASCAGMMKHQYPELLNTLACYNSWIMWRYWNRNAKTSVVASVAPSP